MNYQTIASRKLTASLLTNEHSQTQIFKRTFKITFAVVRDAAVVHGGGILITIHTIEEKSPPQPSNYIESHLW